MMALEDIAQVTAEEFALRVTDLRSRCRQQRLVEARFAGIYLSRQFTELGVEPIAHYYRRHHSVVAYALRQVDAWRTVDAEFRQRLAGLIARLAGRTRQADWVWGESRLCPGTWGWVYVGEMNGGLSDSERKEKYKYEYN